MEPEQFAAILTALAAVLGAVAVCIKEVREYHRAVNSKMDVLLALTATASRAEGVEAQRLRQGNHPAHAVARRQADERTRPAV